MSDIIHTPKNRRVFLKQAAVAGLTVPTMGAVIQACASSTSKVSGGTPAGLPSARPGDWDPVKFNMARGEGGAIPASYMEKIKAADGIEKHLGKHLPYLPSNLPADRAQENYVAIMWGNPDKGYAKHPNAPQSADNPEGHWYNWIRVSISGQDGSEIETKFDGWPKCSDDVKGMLVGLTDADPGAESGKNTVYLSQLPDGAKSGDILRVWAHCLTHGEYLDFVTLA